jgi:CubicO group peptidase (beta-lactamase class C family)
MQHLGLKAIMGTGILALGALGVLGSRVDWRLWTRSLSYPDRPITSADWYQPRYPVLGSPTPPPWTVAAPTGEPGELSLEVLEEVAAFAEEQNSVALLVLHRDRLVFERYWQGHGPEIPVNGMSMTKNLLGLMIGVAMAEGHINALTDRVGDYLPEWAEDPRGDITLADLLYMQSGLRNDDRTDSLSSDLVKLYGGSNLRRLALSIPQVQPPGQGYEYNNVNSQLLAFVLEAATGEPWGDYLSSRLWQPLGASDTFLWMDRPRGSAKAFCCFFATAPDWLRVGHLFLRQGQVGENQVIPADWIEHMRQESPLEPTFGMHLWIKARTPDYPNVNSAASVPFLAPDTFYLDGRHHQKVYVIPSYDLVIVRLGEDPPAWDDAVIPNTLVQAIRSGENPLAPNHLDGNPTPHKP